MNDIALHVENIGKEYELGRKQAAYKTIRESVSAAAMRSVNYVRSFRQRDRKASRAERFWALRDVSFEVKRGEVVGVIGRNGAGKSTLLKILSRITEPSTGFAEIHGRVGSLLEVGTGFHPELSGRENIFLNGAILGMKRSEIERKFDEIVDFAEVEKFIDTAVKHYSSGMYLRLAFAVAAHLEPEILLVDEVLAVGDVAFQKKCLGKMGEVAQAGRTVLFVSHNMGAVTGLCKRTIWIDGGTLVEDGPVDEVTQRYLQILAKTSFNYNSKNFGLDIVRIVLKNSKGDVTSLFCPGEDLIVEIWFNATRRIEKPYIWLKVESLRGSCFSANMLLDGNRPDALDGAGCLTCRFKAIPLLPQSYTIVMAVRTSSREAIVAPQDVASFSVAADLGEYGFKGLHQTMAAGATSVVVPYEWTLPDGSTAPVDLEIKESAGRLPQSNRVE